MEGKKTLITWNTKLDNDYIHTRQIVCKSKVSAKILYNRLSKQEKTVFIKMEQYSNE